MSSLSSDSPHVVILPFMAKGHTIPLLHLTRLLFLRRSNIAITVVTTHANSPFIRQFLSNTKASVIDLTFPQKIHPEIPEGIESVDKLPSQSFLVPFAKATKFLQPEFVLETLRPNVSCVISDGFLPWSLESASILCVPRLAFDEVSNYAMALYKIISEQDFPASSDDEVFEVVPYFPDLKLTKNDFEILSHKSVHGFMSHCGWNSILKSICESVPMLGFPITADQHLNARMVEQYFRIGVKVVTKTGSVRGFFGSECIEKKVKELMNIEDEKCKKMLKNVKKLSEKKLQMQWK